MANQSAWSTEYFDDRPLEYKVQAETAAVASPHDAVPVGSLHPMYVTTGNPAAGRNAGSISRFDVLIVFTCLVPRVLQVLCLIIALSVTAAIPHLSLFSSIKFLLAIDVITLVYSIAQLVWVIYGLVSGNSDQFRGTGSLAAYITFVFDQVLAYSLLAASAAVAALVVFIGDELQVNKHCKLTHSESLGIATPSSCKAKAAAATGILAFALLAFSAAISSQHLHAYIEDAAH